MDFLTPVALAHWIMGDGARSGTGIVLCTDSFTKLEVDRLRLVLLNRYGIYASYHAASNRIYINGCYMDHLRSLVSPHMLPIFYYRIGLPIA
jgi:ubiquinol-cytochrome c reductase cytochrome b subunit